MFCHIFGNYLVEENHLTQNQLAAVLDYLQTIRVKLGFIAVAEKLLTKEQVTEINLMQATMDKRFGDIAVSKGDLTQEQVQYLLNLQGNPYLQFVQAVTDLGYLSLEQMEELLGEYQNKNGFSAQEIEAIKSSDVDRIADVFIHIPDKEANGLVRLALRNINRFICTNFYFGKAYAIRELQVDCMPFQWVKGDVNWFLGFNANDDGLLSAANLYANEVFDRLNDEAKDSIQEFINCTNGLFATKLSQQNVLIDLMPPEYCESKKIVSESDMYVVPVVIHGLNVNLVVAMDTKVKFQK